MGLLLDRLLVMADLAGAEDHLTQRPSLKICDGTSPVDLLRNGSAALGLNGARS